MEIPMKSDLEKVSTLERKLNIEVPLDSVRKAFNDAYKKVQKKAEIKGFRKGKAPMAMIRSMYKDHVTPDVVNGLIQDNYSRALTEHSLAPISSPSIDIEMLGEEDGLKFSASFEIRPEIETVNIKGLEVEKEILEIKDEHIQATIDQLVQSRAKIEPILVDRPAQNSDLVTFDFEATANGMPLPNGQGTQNNLELGSNTSIPGLEDGIIGMKPSDTRVIDLPIPEDYPVPEWAGMNASFKVTMTSISKKVLPEINDEFVKSFGKHETVDEFKTSVRDEITKQEEKRIAEDFKTRILHALVDNNPFEIPKSLKEEQKAKLAQDFQQKMQQQGMPDAEFQANLPKWEADFEKTATFLVHSHFIIDKLAKDNNLEFNESDINEKLEQYSKDSGIEVAQLKSFYQNPEMRNRMGYQITEEKALKLVEGSAKIKEVPRDKLSKID
jgi:trigger factor